MHRFVQASFAATAVALSACGGGGGGKSTPGPTPSPTATPGPVVASPAALVFSAVPSSPLPVSVTQVNGTGGFTVTSSACGSIASGSPAAFNAQFFVAPIAAGTCTITVNGAGGQTAAISITVTTTAVINH